MTLAFVRPSFGALASKNPSTTRYGASGWGGPASASAGAAATHSASHRATVFVVSGRRL